MSVSAPPGGGRFAEALAAVAGVEGWMTDAQARRLWDAASRLRAPATVLEIGAYRGRSAIILARAAAPGVQIVAIDPHAGTDRGPQEIHGTPDEGDADHDAFTANLRAAGVTEAVRHVRAFSQEALGAVEGELDVVYVDGAHRYAPARDDLAGWGARVAPGGTLLVHDAFSSIGVTLALLRLLVFSPAFCYAGRSGSLVEYRREPVAGRARAGNAVRQLAQLGWFARNVAVKVALTLRLRPVARLLGADQWPY